MVRRAGSEPAAVRLVLLFRLRPLELLQDGLFRVVRQQGLQPLSRTLQHDLRFRPAHPFRLAAVGHQPGEEQEGDDHDDQAAAEPEQEAERAVERADAAVEHQVGDAHGDHRDHQQRDQEHAGDR